MAGWLLAMLVPAAGTHPLSSKVMTILGHLGSDSLVLFWDFTITFSTLTHDWFFYTTTKLVLIQRRVQAVATIALMNEGTSLEDDDRPIPLRQVLSGLMSTRDCCWKAAVDVAGWLLAMLVPAASALPSSSEVMTILGSTGV